MQHQQATHAYVTAFVDELARAGVRHACVSPGSRSTPLALVLAAQRRIRLWMHYDERSAGFFALGIAKLSREPVLLVCTSGTAAANYFPAVVEARYARVPLLVVTADRPPELRENGAPQTIDQIKLYGDHAKWFAEVALPEATPSALRWVRTLAGRAAATALVEPAGPVHLNMPFREPLVPLAGEPGWTGDGLGERGRADERAFASYRLGPRAPDERAIEALAGDTAAAERGLIVCGPQDDPGLARGVEALALSTGYPILADPLSGLRTGGHDKAFVVDSYDALLRDEAFVAQHPPDLVLRFGAMPTSKPVLQYLERHPGCRLVIVDGAGGWQDPTSLASLHVHADGTATAFALADARRERSAPRTTEWTRSWLDAARAARAAIRAELGAIDEPFEGRVFAELADLLPDGATLYAGNSMPVRDLDTFFPCVERDVRFLANRGANGIDGVVSSALGAAGVSNGPTVLAIGDVSFYHDLNGLLAAKLHALDATVLLLNNDGGGIFSFLPQAEHGEHFEQLFGTPHGLDFRPAVEMYGGSFERVTEWDRFRVAVREALGCPGLKVIEVPTERRRNVELHRRMWPAVGRALREPQRQGAAGA